MKFTFKNEDKFIDSFLYNKEIIKYSENFNKALSWIDYLMSIAVSVSAKSKDPRTKVGCIAVDPQTKRILGTGYNGFPSGVTESEERWDRPMKYNFVVHAEANLISSAARFGISLNKAVLFVNLIPCVDCSKLIASAGISEIVYIDTGLEEKQTSEWHQKLQFSKQIYQEAGVVLTPVVAI